MSSPDPTYHVLLIGIDAYPVKPLHGCVNDVDAVHRLLVDRARVPEASIRRLTSPHPGSAHGAPPAGSAATLANIRAALAELASGKVSGKDRVLIYYSGHGAHVPVRGAAGNTTHYREALVPVDVQEDPGAPRLLFDFELNGLLADIARQTTSACVILDCCHSAGATREIPGRPERRPRVLLAKDLGLTGPVVVPAARAATLESGLRGMASSVDDCQVVTACLNHELAQEDVTPDGARHGLLTYALVTQLGHVAPDQIHHVPWGRIWQRTRDAVEQANPYQHPWMAGSLARAVLAGPRMEGDVGFAVRRQPGENTYTVEAGTLAGIDRGARVAVYGEEPRTFPDLGSRADLQARLGPLLEIVSAERASAVARCEGAPFEVLDGARARLVAPSPAAKLRCAVVPREAFDVASLRSPLLELVDASAAEVQLSRRPDGTWDLTDDIAGARDGSPPLVKLRPDQLDHAKALLELYHRYALPLRMATSCTDLPGQLRLSVLACPEDGLPEDEADGIALPEQAAHAALTYALEIGDRFCVQVRNASIYRLRVTLVNCAASGKVEHLGDQVLEPRSSQRFWQGSSIGVPFVASAVQGSVRYVDRLVAIGTTLVDEDLRYLKNDIRFSAILARSRGTDKELDAASEGGAPPVPPVEKWTAAHVTLGIGL